MTTSNTIDGTAFTTTMPVINRLGVQLSAALRSLPAPIKPSPSESQTTAMARHRLAPREGLARVQVFRPTFCCPKLMWAPAGPTRSVLFDTSAGVLGVTEIGSAITLGGPGTTPNYVVASPNGTKMFIADPTNHQVIIYDTQSGSTTTATTNQGLSTLAGCIHTLTVGPQVVPTAGVSADDVYVFVANAGSDNLQVMNANPWNGGFGTVARARSRSPWALTRGPAPLTSRWRPLSSSVARD